MTEIISTSNTIPTKETNIQSFIDRVNRIDLDLMDKYKTIRDYGWNERNDLRMNLFNNLNELNLQIVLRFSYEAECIEKLYDKNWIIKRIPQHQETFNKLPDYPKFCSNRINISLNMIKNDFLLKYFFEMESKLRLIVKSIKNIKRKNNKKKICFLKGTEPFNEIYTSFFELYLNLPKKNYEVLRMASILRNTIHNSGFYYHPKEKNTTVQYGGKSYSFIHGKPISFVSDDMLEKIILDLNMLLFKILKHPKIQQFKLMDDPVCKIKFLKI